MTSFDEALKLAAEAAKEDEVPVGAIIIGPDGRIIGRGRNQREKNQDPLAHAEIMAINEAAKTLGSWRLIDCQLIVTLEPCPMCLAAAQQARIASIFYGATDPKGGALSLGYKLNEDTRTNHRFSVTHQPDPRCSEILTAFFKNKRSKNAG
jgi:tRNA(adenine34) deaminase